jgi:capsular polysaccharide biosynthesis protein
MQHVQGTKPRRISPVRITAELDTAVLPLSHYAAIYFGHMVFDGGATSLMASDFGETYLDADLAGNMTDHVARYWKLFGLSYVPVRDVRIRNAWIFDDLGMNAHKSDRLKTMSASVRALPGERSGNGVFVRRRGWGVARAPENEPELEDFFVARGFEVVDPRVMTVDEIAARVCGSRFLVGVEGSGMTHGMLAMAEGTCLVMLFPPWRFNNMMKDYADGLGLRYGFVVGEGRNGNYRVEPEEILRTFDLVAA